MILRYESYGKRVSGWYQKTTLDIIRRRTFPIILDNESRYANERCAKNQRDEGRRFKELFPIDKETSKPRQRQCDCKSYKVKIPLPQTRKSTARDEYSEYCDKSDR